MSGLARLALHHGDAVSGSDKDGSAILDELRELGASVAEGHDAGHVPSDAVVVTTDAIKGANVEVDIARSRGQEIIRRSELLGRMMDRHDGIAIAGTHGKTSTTAMVARVMLDGGLDPTVVVGGEALGQERTAHAGDGKYFVAEACEAYGSFFHLSPKIAVITNIEPDHLDFHGSFDHVRAAFREFAAKLPADGLLIANADDLETACLVADFKGEVATYGLHGGDWRATEVAQHGLTSTFKVERRGTFLAEVALDVPGEHNVSNALAAFAVSARVGLEPKTIAAALHRYKGVRRRFEYMGDRDGARVYDDYAHHPTEIKATLAAARAAFDGKIVAVFQPHLYSRTRDLMDGFIAAFDAADSVIITEVFKSREEPIPGVSGKGISDGVRLRSPGKDVAFVADKLDVPAAVAARISPGGAVIMMGAGDIRCAAEACVQGSGE